MNCFHSKCFPSHHVMQPTLSPLMFETTQWPKKIPKSLPDYDASHPIRDKSP